MLLSAVRGLIGSVALLSAADLLTKSVGFEPVQTVLSLSQLQSALIIVYKRDWLAHSLPSFAFSPALKPNPFKRNLA
jgi:hypothetical protein